MEQGLDIWIGDWICNGRVFFYFCKSVFVGGHPVGGRPNRQESVGNKWNRPESVGNKWKPIQLSVLNPWRDLIMQNSLLILVYKHRSWVHCLSAAWCCNRDCLAGSCLHCRHCSCRCHFTLITPDKPCAVAQVLWEVVEVTWSAAEALTRKGTFYYCTWAARYLTKGNSGTLYFH